MNALKNEVISGTFDQGHKADELRHATGDTQLIHETVEKLLAPNPPQTATVVVTTVEKPKADRKARLIHGCVRSATSGKINLVLDQAEKPLTLKEIGDRVIALGGNGKPTRVQEHLNFWVERGEGIGPMLRLQNGGYFLDKSTK